MSVFAAETTYDLSVAGDNSVIATYDDSTYTLTISGTGATKDYSSSGNPIGRKLSNVKSIIIEEGITHLGNYLFNYTSGSYSTPNLTSTSIVLPSTLKSIGNYTFQYVKAANGTLTMTIPASVESIGEGAFASSNFTAISFEENSKLTEIPEKAFYNMTKISELNIPEGVAFIGDLAFGSSKIANLTLPSTITTLNYGALRNMEYVEAAKCYGSSSMRIILKHILPNGIGPIVVAATLTLGAVILSISSMGYLGLGVASPTPEWGTIISENKINIRYYPYLGLIPGLCIMFTVMAVNFIGDGLRDAFDPKSKN